MALRTTSNKTSAALGTEADDTEAAVDVRLCRAQSDNKMINTQKDNAIRFAGIITRKLAQK